MAEVQTGELGGINLSGEPSLPEDTPKVASLTGEAPTAEAVEAVENALTPAPAADEGSSPLRTYVVLEQGEFAEGGVYFQEVGRVEARNGQNATRKAFKEMVGREQTEATTLVVVSERMWQPTAVKIKRTENVSVTLG